MNGIKTFFSTNWQTLLAVLLLVLVVYLIYRSGKTAGTNNVSVVDDQGNPVNATPAQQAEAAQIAKRIYDDLNSGAIAGYNFFSSLGRDTEAYELFANMSDTMFAFTAQFYRAVYNSSIIEDIRNESSLATGGIGSSQSPKDIILAKAQRLNLA